MAAIMQSMELADEESLDAPMPITMPEKPDYPYGLRICLTDAELAKLKLDPAQAMESIGGVVHGHFIGRVTSASMDQREGGDSCSRIEIQITDLALESEDAEADVATPPARRLSYANTR